MGEFFSDILILLLAQESMTEESQEFMTGVTRVHDRGVTGVFDKKLIFGSNDIILPLSLHASTFKGS